MPGRWFGQSSSLVQHGEEISWTSPSEVRNPRNSHSSSGSKGKGDFANIAMEQLLFYKTKCAEI